eukprot:jgi/Mesen1/5540/ME000280S04660
MSRSQTLAFIPILQTLLCLCLGICLSSVTAADKQVVTFGSVIKLQHDRLHMKLHSHEVTYGSGSGQQSVTGFTGGDDANSYWVVRCILDEDCKQGDPVKDGMKVRLQHMVTRRWLHSHLHASPLSNNLEVSCFGTEEQSDTGDYWKVEVEGKAGVWMQDKKVRLLHVDTGGYLHSHDKKYGRPIAGQYEVCAMQRKTSDGLWVATEGVYMGTPQRNSRASS